MTTPTLHDLKKQIEDLENRITDEIHRNSDVFRYRLRGRKPIFDRKTIQEYRKKATRSLLWLLDSPVLYILSSPVIYSLIVPALLLDLWVSIYQSINFRIYRIARVRRRDHIILDRHHLPYLNIIEKTNCLYCGYFNGLMSYISEIAARTEQFWCPIRHARPDAPRHSRSHNFMAYGDPEYQDRLLEIRDELRRITFNLDSVREKKENL